MMPPEYLTVQEAKRMQEAMAREFGEFRTEVRTDVKGAQAQVGKLEIAVTENKKDIEGLGKDIKALVDAIKDRKQMWATVVMWSIMALISLPSAIQAWGSIGK